MPRDGSGQYSAPPGTDGAPDTTIDSAKYNLFIADLEQVLNTPAPIGSGGTGGGTVDEALTSLHAEKSGQQVTNYDSMAWMSGSFWSNASATNPPVAGHAFSGIVYVTDANNIFVEARDRDATTPPGPLYIRQKKAGVWTGWLTVPTVDPTAFVAKAGDTMTGPLVLAADPAAALGAATKQYVDSHSGTGAVRYDAAQSLTYLQQAQARSNTGALKKNYIINGAMVISQENGSVAGSTTTYYPVDQFLTAFSNEGAISAQQVASVTPGGSPNRLRITVTTADSIVGAGNFSCIMQRIEGVRVADLKFGTASAKAITVQFGVKAPQGTYCVVVLNGAVNRTYVAEYVIAAGEANIDTVKSVTIPGDTAGTWAVDSSIGLAVYWSLMVGSSLQQAAGAWGTANTIGSANQFNFMGTNGNVFELFDVGLYEGNAAPPFQVPDFAPEMLACQRYFQTLGVPYGTVPADAAHLGANKNGIAFSTAAVHIPVPLNVTMRASPTGTFFRANVTGPAAGQWAYYNGGTANWIGGATSVSNADPNAVTIQIVGLTGLTIAQALLCNGIAKLSSRI